MSLIFLYASGNQQLPAINGEQFPKVSGWTELKPVLRLPWQQEWVLEAECTDFVLQSHIKAAAAGRAGPWMAVAHTSYLEHPGIFIL